MQALSAQEKSPFQIDSIFPTLLEAHRYPAQIDPSQQPQLALQAEITMFAPTHWQATLRASVTFATNSPFDLSVNMVGIFVPSQPVDDLQALASAHANEQFAILLPYVREAILEMSVRLRLPLLVIPYINTTDIVAVETPSTLSANEPEKNRTTRPRRKKSGSAE